MLREQLRRSEARGANVQRLLSLEKKEVEELQVQVREQLHVRSSGHSPLSLCQSFSKSLLYMPGLGCHITLLLRVHSNFANRNMAHTREG